MFTSSVMVVSVLAWSSISLQYQPSSGPATVSSRKNYFQNAQIKFNFIAQFLLLNFSRDGKSLNGRKDISYIASTSG